MAQYYQPEIHWVQLLKSSPYFSSVLIELTPQSEINNLSPLAKAIYYYSLFDGDVSNGGVMQYFFNQFNSLPDFDRAADIIGVHPVLKTIEPLVQEVHQAWRSVKDEVERAKEVGEWPEALFSAYSDKFSDLQKMFFRNNHEIAHAINAEIVKNPEDYFRLLPLDELSGNGVDVIELEQGKIRLRFENGFPVGPNLFENANGECDVVWFNKARDLLISETGYRENRFRHWIHYPSSISGQWILKESKLENYKSQKGLWNEHGVSCSFASTGSIQQERITNNQQELLVNRYLSDGRYFMSEQKTAEGVLIHRYWPNGKLNTLSIRDAAFVEKYSECFDEKGHALIANGSGRFHQFLGVVEGRCAWREGHLINGYLQGEVIWYVEDADGNPTVASKANFVDGKQ